MFTVPYYSQGFLHPRWCRISSINSITTKNKPITYNLQLKKVDSLQHFARWAVDGYSARLSAVWSQCLLILMSGPVIALRQKSFHSSRSSSRCLGLFGCSAVQIKHTWWIYVQLRSFGRLWLISGSQTSHLKSLIEWQRRGWCHPLKREDASLLKTEMLAL